MKHGKSRTKRAIPLAMSAKFSLLSAFSTQLARELITGATILPGNYPVVVNYGRA